MASSSTRAARLEARITPEVQRQLKRAAEIQGRSVSDFVVAAATEAARRTLAEAELFRLSEEAQIAFARALIEPPAPTESLRRAAARHQARFGL
ncbi:MAG TPA: DUF1778 domain-containing protein [Caulobacteraceae bacterium]